MHDLHFFTNLAFVFTVAVLAALALAPLRLPPVLAYLGTGIVLGPPVLGLVAHDEAIEVIAEVGVVLLLFTVGLEFSVSELKRSWRAVLLAGGLQMGVTVVAIAMLAHLAGFSWPTAVAMGLLTGPSSTAVVLRMLQARGEDKAAHGRLILGVLLFQDLAVVGIMLALPVLAGTTDGIASLAWVLAKATGIVLVTLALSQWVVPRAFRAVARLRNREVFLLAVLGVAGLTAWLTSVVGLSLALGAFVAGMVLADTEYAHQALAEVLPFRTVMMCVFFVGVGMLLDVDVLMAHPQAVATAVGAVVLVKLGAMWLVGIALRFPVRIAGLAAVALSQIGEFSLVLSARATDVGLISDLEGRIFLAAAVVTLVATPLLIAAFPRLLAGSRALEPFERLLDRKVHAEPNVEEAPLQGHAIVAGLGVAGRTVISAIEGVGMDLVIVELNPNTVELERRRGRRVVYGDIAAPEVLDHAGVATARVVCLVTSDLASSRRAIEAVRERRPDLPIVLRTRWASEEGAERSPNVEVISEEFSGAATIAGAVLRACGVTQWTEVLNQLVAAQREVPAEEESELGPPPKHPVLPLPFGES